MLEDVKIVAGASCGSGDSCPRVYSLGKCDLIIQGYRLSPEERDLLPAPPCGEDVVRIPSALIEQLLIKRRNGDMGAMQ